MSQFSVGDRVIYRNITIPVIDLDGKIATVITSNTHDTRVMFDHGQEWVADNKNLTLLPTTQVNCPITLPVGIGGALGSNAATSGAGSAGIPSSAIYLQSNDNKTYSTLPDLREYIETSVPECDCGGFKTYNTMSPEAHSTWCKSIISSKV